MFSIYKKVFVIYKIKSAVILYKKIVIQSILKSFNHTNFHILFIKP